MTSCLGNQCIDETHNPLHENIISIENVPTMATIGVIDREHDIEMGELLSADECTICFSDIPSNDCSYGCGNSKCNGKFCDECVVGLSERHIHTPRCCNCTEPCGTIYTSRLNRMQIVLFVYNGDHYMVTTSIGPHESHAAKHIKFVTSPIVDANLNTFRSAYMRATDLANESVVAQYNAFNRSARRGIKWLHAVDNVRWGKLVHAHRRYVTLNYYLIYLMNGLVAIIMFGILLVFGRKMVTPNSNFFDVLCLFINVIVTIASYWLFMLQILYEDVNVISKNRVRWRLFVFGTSTAIIISNNVLMLERTLGDGEYMHVAMYASNIVMRACVAMWTKCLAIGD